jgi:hypothetical protein
MHRCRKSPEREWNMNKCPRKLFSMMSDDQIFFNKFEKCLWKINAVIVSGVLVTVVYSLSILFYFLPLNRRWRTRTVFFSGGRWEGSEIASGLHGTRLWKTAPNFQGHPVRLPRQDESWAAGVGVTRYDAHALGLGPARRHSPFSQASHREESCWPRGCPTRRWICTWGSAAP